MIFLSQLRPAIKNLSTVCPERPRNFLLPLRLCASAVKNPIRWIQNGRGSYTLYAIGFRFSFTPLAGVLFAFPSRYWFTIGRQGVFSLIPWSGQIQAEFHVHRLTWDTSRGLANFAHPALTVCGRFFQIVKLALYLPHRGPSTPGRQVLPV